MEKTLFDRYFSGYLLKKRKIWKPFKYNLPPPFLVTRWMDAIVMPQNKFENLLSNLFERSLPTLTYFTWRIQMINAREEGWTIQEKFFNHFFRQKNIYYHAYAQQLHPWSYIDRQRADQFYRRLQTLLPGCECPAWGRQNRRVPEVDFDSLFTVSDAYNQVAQEATPSPHYNTPNFFFLQHFFNNRFNFGVYASRIFFNEEPKGDYLNTGHYTKGDLEMIDSWYAGDKNAIAHKIGHMSKEEREILVQNVNRWKKNFEIYFPETKGMKVEPSSHKFAQELYYNRNVEELRDKIFINKYVNAIKNNTFNQNEWTQIREVLLAQVDSHFFEKSSHDDQFHATELFKRFTAAFDLPDLFSCSNKSGKLPETQYLDKTDLKWNINYHTVSLARNTFDDLLQHFRKNNEFYTKMDSSELSAADKTTISNRIRMLISEEVYNPLFVSRLQGEGQQNVVCNNIKSLDDIERLFEVLQQSNEEIQFLNRKVFNSFLYRCRAILQTVPFVPSN